MFLNLTPPLVRKVGNPSSHKNEISLLLLGCKRLSSMSAWKIHDSLDNQDVDICEKLSFCSTQIPTINTPSQALIKVHASSINPLDYRMIYGYGRRILDLMAMSLNYESRVTNDRYPLTLGRDFSGQVVAAGPKAGCHPGDLVFGAIEPHRAGAHAEYVIANGCCISEKPENITHLEAASIPFTALTCYSALCTFGGLNRQNCQGKEVLVVGGSGGVGSFAIQLLKLWGARVMATCSQEKMDWLKDGLFVDEAFDHDDKSQLSALNGKFDFILDCGAYDEAQVSHHDRVEFWSTLLKPRNCSIYVTLSPPFLSRIDQHGILLGTGRSLIEATLDTLSGLKNLNSPRWAFFMPNKEALSYVTNLYSECSILPQVSSVYGYKQVPEGYKELVSGQTRGKVVIDMTKAITKGNNKEQTGHKSTVQQEEAR